MKPHTAKREPRAGRAVSSMLGVKAMVAITVILGFTIGAFGLDVTGDLKQASPAAGFVVTVNAPDNVVKVRHDGGERLVAADVEIVVTDGTDSLVFNSKDAAALTVGESFEVDTNATTVTGWSGAAYTEASGGGGFTFSTGDEITVQLIDTEGQQLLFETSFVV